MWTDLIGRRRALQIQREPIKSIKIALNFTKQPCGEIAKEGIMHIKNMQSNKMKIIQHIAEAFHRKYSDVSPFVIVSIILK